MKTKFNVKRYFQVLGVSLSVLLVVVLGVLGYKIIGSDFSADEGLSRDEIATVKLQERTDCVNILLLGVDEGGLRSDTIMLVSYDPKIREVNTMSIPRDTRIFAGGKTRKINATSAYTSSNGKPIGPQGVVEAVSRLTGVPIHYYISFTFEGVAECIDALGPVTYTIEKPMVYNDPAQDLHINLRAGTQELDGEQCVHFLRYRKGDKGYASYGDGSDTSRIHKQQDFLKEVMRQKFNAKLILKVPDILQAVSKNVKTNLDIKDMMYYASHFKDYKAINFASNNSEIEDELYMVGGVNAKNPEDAKTLTVRMLSLAGRNSEDGEYDASYWLCDIEKTKEDVMMYFGVDEETAAKITVGEVASKKTDKKSSQTTKSTQKATKTTKPSKAVTVDDDDDDDKVTSTKKPSSTASTKKTQTPKATKKPVTDNSDKDDENTVTEKDEDTKEPTKKPVATKSPTKEPVKSTPKPVEREEEEEKPQPTKAPVIQKKEE